jgi:hypothetical protein
VGYAVLLKLTARFAALPVDQLHVNVKNVFVAVAALFLPEELLARLNPFAAALPILAVLGCAAFLPLKSPGTLALRRAGALLLVIATLPVLAIGDFTFATSRSPFIDLMGSPSHRIYLASAGAALVAGALLRALEEACGPALRRWALLPAVALLTAWLVGDCAVVRARDPLWEAEGNKARAVMEFLQNYRGQAAEGSQIGLINFPVSRIYMEPTIKDHLGIHEATFNHYVNVGIMVEPRILENAERSCLFVFVRDGRVYDLSGAYQRQLVASRTALTGSGDPRELAEAQTVTFELIREINRIVGL